MGLTESGEGKQSQQKERNGFPDRSIMGEKVSGREDGGSGDDGNSQKERDRKGGRFLRRAGAGGFRGGVQMGTRMWFIVHGVVRVDSVSVLKDLQKKS